MAAIPPPSDNGSVVVRVPVPTQVASPQPAPPPKPAPKPAAPRATFILPGGVTPTPTRPLKFARLADTRHFAHSLFDASEKTWHDVGAGTGPITPAQQKAYNKGFGRADVHGVLADYLADHDDPREDVVRRSQDLESALAASRGVPVLPRAVHYRPTRPARFIELSDGTQMSFTKHTTKGSDFEKPSWVVHWSGPAHNWYHAPMSHDEFKSWLRRFDTDELSRIVKGMRNGR